MEVPAQHYGLAFSDSLPSYVCEPYDIFPQVLGFLIQQTRGYLTEDVRLVDSRNRMGETALLRAMNTGVNSVIKVPPQCWYCAE